MATMTPAPAGGGRMPRGNDETTFTRAMKWEVASEEGAALRNSYFISITLGLAWLALVYWGPRTEAPTLLPPDAEPIEIVLPEDVPPPTPIEPPVAQTGTAERTPAPGPTNKRPGPTGPQAGSPRPGRPGSRTEQRSTGAVGDAFGTGSGSGTGGMVGDVSGILAGVDVGSGSGGTGGGLGGSGGGGAGGKAVLGNGQGGQGSRTPGRGGIGGGSGTGGGGGGGIGGVGRGGGIVAAPVRVGAPRVVDAGDIGGPRRNTDELGSFVRSRESQLRFCYTEFGLKTNPGLAGSITTNISLTESGSVTGVNISNRSWGGAGSSEAENCIRGKIRGWRFPSGTAGTYAFSFNFTR
jgi:hypothetical protein